MNTKQVTAHVLVRNEDRFIWFAIMSVIDFVDKMIIFDTASTDKTVDIINLIINSKKEYKQKIIFEEKGKSDRERIAKLRQEMIDRTETEYFMILDGDEIWWESSIKEAINILNEDTPPLLAQRCIKCARDIRHYRDPKRDLYIFLDTEHAANIRFYSMKIPGIHCGGYYGIEGFFDKDNNEVQCGKYEIKWQNGLYFHPSFLRRSSQSISDFFVYRRFTKQFPRYDYEFSIDYKYPEVFYSDALPSMVKSPFAKETISARSLIYFILDDLHFRTILNMLRKDNTQVNAEKIHNANQDVGKK